MLLKMKYLLLILFFFGIQFSNGQSIDEDGRTYFEMKEGDTTYVMYQYFFCSLDRVESRDSLSQERIAEIQKGHMDHIGALADAGIVSIAGPYGDDGESRGILIMNCATLEEAQAHAAKDPAVQANRLKINIRPIWLAKGSKLN